MGLGGSCAGAGHWDHLIRQGAEPALIGPCHAELPQACGEGWSHFSLVLGSHRLEWEAPALKSSEGPGQLSRG